MFKIKTGFEQLQLYSIQQSTLGVLSELAQDGFQLADIEFLVPNLLLLFQQPQVSAGVGTTTSGRGQKVAGQVRTCTGVSADRNLQIETTLVSFELTNIRQQRSLGLR